LILLRLKGGLGNQLFQLGAAIRLAKFDTSLIRLDKSLLSDSQKTILNELINKPDLIPKAIENEELELFKSDAKKIFSISDSDNGPFSDNSQLDWEVDFNAINILLEGYFQCDKNIYALKKHVEDLSNIASNSFSNKNSEKLVIHYRQGDYLRTDVQRELGLIKLDYIDRAINTYSNDRNIDIHSDTIGILERYRHKKNIELKIGESEIKTFIDFMSAQILVIPNSTFSLSAALLSDNLKILIRPTRWSKKYIRDELTINLNAVQYLSNSFF
jgi:hypothetical protein